MAKAATGWHEPMEFPTAHLHVEFDAGRPLDYPMALNGRSITSVSIDGVPYGPYCGGDVYETEMRDGALAITAVVMGGVRFERVGE